MEESCGAAEASLRSNVSPRSLRSEANTAEQGKREETELFSVSSLNITATRVERAKKKGPRFFKVFLPGLCSKQLEISPAFRKHVQRMLPASTCLLTGPSGRAWRVDMIKNEKGRVFFQNGWEEFVGDHSLQTGEFLVFEYKGGSRFSVMVFDASLCEKWSAFDAVPSSFQCSVGCAEGSGHRGRRAKGEPFSSDSSENRSMAAPTRKGGTGGSLAGRCLPRERAVRKPQTRKRYIYSCFAQRVPTSFSRQHLSDNKKMTFWDPTGKPWPVNYISCNGRHFFSGGWRNFALANFLEQDDACVLELIGPNEFRAHVFRVVEEIMPLIRKKGF
ncbi:hypothetical protein Taro_046780 [Colocasia esculenta]|uniref:TF-B3 domain-containing protein n=1 Tax=Colocasia esculenta TaxID=4460 RepID=A0A843X6J5_COLES|nr:hypothetical protein [Colocasia esculenta]